MTHKKAGRPRQLNSLGTLFRKLWLDPFQTPHSISKTLGISLRTFYRYEAELALPTLRVALGQLQDLPAEKALLNLKKNPNLDTQIICDLGQRLGIRMQLLPCTGRTGQTLLGQKRVDLYLGRRAWTKTLSERFYGSDHYLGKLSPEGVFFESALRNSFSGTLKKPKLGVYRDSIHFEYAHQNLQSEFSLHTFQNYHQLFDSLAKGHLDFTFAHINIPETIGLNSRNFRAIGKPIRFNTKSVILFHENSADWRFEINRGLMLREEDELNNL